MTLVGSLSAARPHLKGVKYRGLETKVTRFYCLQKGPPAMTEQPPGVPAERPAPTIPARCFAEAGSRPPCRINPSPSPGFGQVTWLIIQRVEYFFRGQRERSFLSFAETSLWGPGGGSGRRSGVERGSWRFSVSQNT